MLELTNHYLESWYAQFKKGYYSLMPSQLLKSCLIQDKSRRFVANGWTGVDKSYSIKYKETWSAEYWRVNDWKSALTRLVWCQFQMMDEEVAKKLLPLLLGMTWKQPTAVPWPRLCRSCRQPLPMAWS